MKEDKHKHDPKNPGELMRKWDLHSKEDFTSFYDYWAPKIYQHAFLRTSSQETAKDITSKAFLNILEYVKKKKQIRNPSAFLYKVVNHLVVDYYRSNTSKSINISSLQELEDPAADEAAVDAVNIRYNLMLVKNALGKLNPQESLIIVMRFIEELSIEEIALTLGKSRGAVSVAIHRALRNLKRIIEKDYGKLI
ncbi:MAG: RNA polymerase sigma factor [Candidatus Paceibacteria bacterium]